MGRHVEAAAHETAVNASHSMAVQKHLSLPVDPIEIEPRVLTRMRAVGQD